MAGKNDDGGSFADWVFRAEITIRYVEPTPRRVLLLPDMSLGGLHSVIQTCFLWENYHLWEFVVGKMRYSPAASDFDFDPAGDPEDAWLSGIYDNGVRKLSYTYDFGDGWEHDIRLRKLSKKDLKTAYEGPLPRCLEGAEPGPFEDCGGAWGYANLKELAASDDPLAREDLAELGWEEAPEFGTFDIDELNARLSRMKFSDPYENATELSFRITEEGEVLDADGNVVPLSHEFVADVDACLALLEGPILNEEFKTQCRTMLLEAAARGVNIQSGKAGGWAAGAVNQVAATNGLTQIQDMAFPTMGEVAKACGVSPATLHNRGRKLRDEVEVAEFGDPRFALQSVETPLTMMSDMLRRMTPLVAEASGQDVQEVVEAMNAMSDAEFLASVQRGTAINLPKPR